MKMLIPPVSPYPPYPHPPSNRVKPLLEYLDLITPQEPKITPQDASPADPGGRHDKTRKLAGSQMN